MPVLELSKEDQDMVMEILEAHIAYYTCHLSLFNEKQGRPELPAYYAEMVRIYQGLHDRLSVADKEQE